MNRRRFLGGAISVMALAATLKFTSMPGSSKIKLSPVTNNGEISIKWNASELTMNIHDPALEEITAKIAKRWESQMKSRLAQIAVDRYS